MGFYSSIEVSATGLSAERLAMDTIANNIANVNTTRTAEGGPFKRQFVIFAQKTDSSNGDAQDGVEAVGIAHDQSPDKLIYDPGHPDADLNGYVHMPNVDVVKEMVDLMSASRAYEANVTAIQEARSMDTAAVDLLKA
jgi:flagellar basal-body rod protein FlgC